MARAMTSVGSLGSNSRLYNSAACNFTTEDFSIAMWLYPTGDGADDTLLFKGRYGNAGWYVAIGRTSSRDIQFVSYNGSGVDETKSNGSVIDLNAWQHVCLTRSGGTIKFYKNGVEVSYAATGSHTTIASSSDDFQIGAYYNREDLSCPGRYAEVAVYDVALGAGHVASLAAAFSPRSVAVANLINYWPLIGRLSPEPDFVGGQALSLLTMDQADHPRVIYPRRRSTARNGTAAPATTFGFLRANAGVGSMGGGPFSRASAGLGVLA